MYNIQWILIKNPVTFTGFFSYKIYVEIDETKKIKNQNTMKPLSAKTEFSFSIKREFINVISDTFEGGLFEKLDINYGKKNHNILGTCHVKYTLQTSIQQVLLNRISERLIIKLQSNHKAEFFKRIAEVKKEIKEVKIKTMLSFIDTITPQI